MVQFFTYILVYYLFIIKYLYFFLFNKNTITRFLITDEILKIIKLK